MMNLERAMKTESSQTHLRNKPDAADAQRVDPTTMSVKEAADRLGVPCWKVYRMDRKEGPFRFVLEGRRVFIDVTSFELHLRNVAGICANDCLALAENVEPVQQPVKVLDTQLLVDRQQPASPDAPMPRTSPLPSRGGGQREHIMRVPSGPSFFSFPSFM
jgi:hypothetical protein